MLNPNRLADLERSVKDSLRSIIDAIALNTGEEIEIDVTHERIPIMYTDSCGMIVPGSLNRVMVDENHRHLLAWVEDGRDEIDEDDRIDFNLRHICASPMNTATLFQLESYLFNLYKNENLGRNHQ